MKEVILEKRPDYWGAWLYGIDRMPEDIELPLPWSPLASLMRVAADMRARFPGAIVWHRENGTLTRVVEFVP
jgi:hypothetical protein